jgi:hypothetical protein
MNFDSKKEIPIFFFRAGVPLNPTVETFRKDVNEVIKYEK